MASIRTSRGKLFIDYRANGERQRVYTGLADTPANHARLAAPAQHIDRAIKAGECIQDVLVAFGLASETTSVASTAAIAPVAPVRQKSSFTETHLLVTAPAFIAFAEQWFSEFKVGWRKTYEATVHGILEQHLLPRFGRHAVSAITRAEILEFRAHLASLRGRREGTKLSPARINTIMLILRQILQEAADRYEFTMPMGRLRPLKVPKSDVAPFSLPEVQRLLQTIRPDYRNYLTVRFFTGMRSGEIHGLKWKYVDFERRLILVRETIVGGEEEYTKTDASQRDIVMSEVVFEALRAQRRATGNRDYVFCNLKGEPLDTINFTKRVWYPLLRHLGLELRRPYQTRHTAATLWLAAGETPEWIARQLGHASTEMLFRVYSRFVPNLTRRDGSAFDRLLTQAFTPKDKNDGRDAQPPPHLMRLAA
ncbi:tyrosine-type recombinase/integrase [Inhella proteolytica]|uniref:Tyrosine-type recombinase/integrase n=1 Tax=Inhella proteolytica TaxID=2795029 RepID=A0A931J7C9_9BURK|nr:tyrosine-type recombinase/integrase [Inhella proteolytica]MBH9578157.1 tyrosine-type recombinase/integrase [Inhella proteolytica]